MATERRAPEDLQEAVAATLRRLRGEAVSPGVNPAPRIEPQLTMPISPVSLVPPPPPPSPAPPPQPSPVPQPAALRVEPAPVRPAPSPPVQPEPVQAGVGLSGSGASGPGASPEPEASPEPVPAMPSESQLPSPAAPSLSASPPDPTPSLSSPSITSLGGTTSTARAAVEPDLLSAFAAEPEMPLPLTAEATSLETGEDGAPQRRHWLRYVLALIAIGAFGSAGWWIYRISTRPHGGEVPVIQAEQTPEKVPPADQPANQSQGQPPSATVYEQIAPGGSQTAQQPEVLLPQPETPALPPAPPANGTAAAAASSTAQPATEAGTGAAVPSDTSGTTSQPAPSEATSSQATATQSATAATTETLLPPAPPASTSASSPSASATQPTLPAVPEAPSQPAAASASSSQPAEQSATAAATTASGTAASGTSASSAATAPSAAPSAGVAAPNDRPTAAGNYRVQLASLKTEADAKKTWKRLAAKYPDMLAPLALHLEKVDLGTKGIYYRVQAGPFTDKAAAKDICAKLKAKNQQCIVKP
jgi:hypothetical protein